MGHASGSGRAIIMNGDATKIPIAIIGAGATTVTIIIGMTTKIEED